MRHGQGETRAMIIENTAREFESERRSRWFNAIEAFFVYTFILVVLWPICYYLGILPGVEESVVEQWALPPLLLGGIYLLFIAPRVHGDSAASWGLGNPVKLFRSFREGSDFERKRLPWIVLALFLVLNGVVYWRWPDVTDLFGVDKLVLGGLPITEFHHHFPSVLVVFLAGSLLAGAYVTCALRYDNFVPAFLMAMKISVPLAAVIWIGALATAFIQGTNPFEGMRADKYVLDMLGYTFWGFLQQLLFTAYLGNRFRKAFPPSLSESNTLPPEKRIPFAITIGAVGGMAVSLLAVWGLSVAYPDEPEPGLSALFWFFVFTAPLCGWYGYVLALDRKRLIVASLASSCFAFIHIDSYGLVGATWLLGTVLIYLSMEDRYRNLVALGMMHGILGSTFGALFSKGRSGTLEVDYSVGPWGVDDPTLAVLWFPMACIAAYVALMIWSYFHLRHQPNVLPGHEARLS
jgi:hypothetical protein